MIRYLSCALFFIASFFYATGNTATVYDFSSAVGIEVPLPPNEPQIFNNFLLWKIKGICEVISDSSQNPLSFKMQKNKGSIDSVEFVQGDSIFISAYAGQRFELIAESKAKIEVTNQGKTTIKLKCSN